MDKIFEVLRFDRISQYDLLAKKGGAFTDYVITFLKMKQEASGLPEWCKTDEEIFNYIEEYHQREGIRLEYYKIALNPVLYYGKIVHGELYVFICICFYLYFMK